MAMRPVKRPMRRFPYVFLVRTRPYVRRIDTGRIMAVVARMKPLWHLLAMPIFPGTPIGRVRAIKFRGRAITIFTDKASPWPTAVRTVSPVDAESNLCPKKRFMRSTPSDRLTGLGTISCRPLPQPRRKDVKRDAATLAYARNEWVLSHDRTPYKREVMRLAV